MDKQQLKYGPVSALLVTVGSFFGSQLAVGFLIGLVPAVLFGWKEARISAWLNSGDLPQAIIISLSGITTVFLIGWFIKSRGNRFKQLGFNQPKAAIIWQAGLAFLVYMAGYLILLTTIKILVPSLNLNQKQDLGFNYGAPSSIGLLIFSLVIVPPLVEETVMRGFLFGGLRTKMPFISAALITSTIFAAAHLPAGKDGLLWVGAIDTFVLSLVLCYLREKTGSLWASILLHAMKNSVALIFLLHGSQ